jgi:hypothetical protein
MGLGCARTQAAAERLGGEHLAAARVSEGLCASGCAWAACCLHTQQGRLAECSPDNVCSLAPAPARCPWLPAGRRAGNVPCRTPGRAAAG